MQEKKRLVLHVGHPKTGTSTIQQALSNNADLLYELGYHYPNFGQIHNGHHLLVNSLVYHTNNFLTPPGISGQAVVRELKKTLSDSALHTVILSSEGFYSATDFKKAFSAIEDLFQIEIFGL